MSLSAKFRRAPLRLAAGAYILNTGVTTLNADDETAKSLHGMASGTYPVFGKLEPKVLARSLAVGEIAVGAMLLLPIAAVRRWRGAGRLLGRAAQHVLAHAGHAPRGQPAPDRTGHTDLGGRVDARRRRRADDRRNARGRT